MNDDDVHKLEYAGPREPKPVRVKAYGLVPLTKATYLSMQAIGAVVLVGLYLFADALPAPAEYQQYWRVFIMIIAVLEVIEPTVMLWKFRAAEQKARENQRFPPMS
jgi:hypothetical protein